MAEAGTRFAWHPTASTPHLTCCVLESHGPMSVSGIRQTIVALGAFRTTSAVRQAVRSLRIQGLIVKRPDGTWRLSESTS